MSKIFECIWEAGVRRQLAVFPKSEPSLWRVRFGKEEGDCGHEAFANSESAVEQASSDEAAKHMLSKTDSVYIPQAKERDAALSPVHLPSPDIGFASASLRPVNPVRLNKL